MRQYSSLPPDMDFRVIPSAVPLQSPSPDNRIINIITPTISPNALQIKKRSTPIKIFKDKQNKKDISEMETQIKYGSYTPTSADQQIQKKDEQIRSLKTIINKLTESGRSKKSGEQEDEDWKNQVRILTIQNQKLVSVIEKIKRENSSRSQEVYENKIYELSKSLKQNKNHYEQQEKELKRFIKSLSNQVKSLENQNAELEEENKKLTKYLKQKNENERKNSDKSRLSEASEHSNSNQQKSQSSSKNQQKLSLMKIREQHSENLKALKEGLIRQIEETFETIRIALEGINSKVMGMSKRLEGLQKISISRIQKTHVQTERITISIRESSEAANAPQTDRSLKIQKKNNSEIYIEQGLSSSHEKASRDEFSRLEQVASQKNLKNPLQNQISALKIQLSDLKLKYESKCKELIEKSSQSEKISQSEKVSYSVDSNQFNKFQEKYDQVLKNLQEKQKQTAFLYEQINKNSKIHYTQLYQKDNQIQLRQNEIEQIKAKHQKQIKQMKIETELKVKQLVQIYEKQMNILKKQIQSRSINSQQISQKFTLREQQLKSKLQEVYNKAVSEEQQKARTTNQFKSLIQKHANEQSIWRNLQKNMQDEMRILHEGSEAHRIAKQQFEQQSLLKLLEISKLKYEIQQSKNRLNSNHDEVQQLKSQISQINRLLNISEQQNIKLRSQLIQKQQIISKLRQNLAQWNNSGILQQINEVKQLIQSNGELHAQQQKYKAEAEQRIQQTANLRKTNQNLRQQVRSKQLQIIERESKIQQLQKIAQVLNSKISEQYSLYEELVQKLARTQKESTLITVKIEGQQDNQRKRRANAILDELREREERRLAEVNKLLEKGQNF